MKKSLQKLIDTLELELELYQSLLSLLNEERTALVQMHIDEVHNFNIMKERILFDIETTELKRGKVVVDLAELTGIDAKDMSISKLKTVIPEAQIGAMTQLQNKLNSVLHEIAEVNAVNGMLVEKTDKFLSRCIKFIKTVCTPVSVYMSTGVSSVDTRQVGNLICEKG